MRSLLLRYLLLLLAWGTVAHAEEPIQPPTQGDIDAVRQRNRLAREALSTSAMGSKLSKEHRQSLLAGLDATEKALEQYEKLRCQRARRQEVTRPLYVAGAAVLIDDVSGVGVLDDALVPFIGLGILGAYPVTRPPVSPADLNHSWMEVVTALEEVGHVAAGIAAGSRSIPSRKNCRQHLIQCLRTSLGRPGSGRSPNHSICADCFERCRSGEWPDVGHDKKDCRWWDYQ